MPTEETRLALCNAAMTCRCIRNSRLPASPAAMWFCTIPSFVRSLSTANRPCRLSSFPPDSVPGNKIAGSVHIPANACDSRNLATLLDRQVAHRLQMHLVMLFHRVDRCHAPLMLLGPHKC